MDELSIYPLINKWILPLSLVFRVVFLFKEENNYVTTFDFL